MAKDQTIQSLDRGLAILQLLAEKKQMTASLIAAELGVHQSTASRLLNSLHKGGMVKKPDFHSFSLDYGTLIFAGLAMQCFPAITTSVKVCNRIMTETGVNAAVAVLRDKKLLYLTQCDNAGADSRLRLINDSAFPVHKSILGLALAWSSGEERALEILSGSIDKAGGGYDSQQLYSEVDRSMKDYGFLLQKNNSGFKASLVFELDGEMAALALFSYDKQFTNDKLRKYLELGVNEIRGF